MSLGRHLTSALVGAGLIVSSAFADESDPPETVQDLRYGQVLFEYHQGRSFEALSLLNVAKQQGGIKNHGDHPALVEGGLMLAYGMTREAKQRFEAVLQDQVTPESRNAAWYYLGKVFYLEQDNEQAKQALAQVDPALLEDSNPDLFQELVYLNAQLQDRMGESIDQTLPEDLMFASYIRYNQAINTYSENADASFTQLTALSNTLAEALEEGDVQKTEKREARALIARIHLTLGQWALQEQAFETALAMLQKIRFDSVFSDQALFQYAVAATHIEKYGLALEALNILQSRESFNPWLQQVPYALAYLYEQMKELPLALQAYQAAGEHYQQLLQTLQNQSDNLNEAQIIAALRFEAKSVESDAVSAKSSELQLGVSDIRNDAYGRIRVEPVDFTYAALLSQESFQLGLRDLHELYKLKNSLDRWQSQLDSFDVMLETRSAQRKVRVGETQAALAAQETSQWHALQKGYAAQIDEAVQTEDVAFFMDEDQLDFQSQIEQVYANLSALSETDFLDADEKDEYRLKIDRINAYFTWWVADRYSVNRWAAQKQMKELNTAMDEFNARNAVLQSELASDMRLSALQGRVDDGQRRLLGLQAGIEQALVAARGDLIALVRAELQRQQTEVAQYVRVSKRAEARIADTLYQRTQSDSDVEGGAAASTETTEPAQSDSEEAQP